MVKVISWNIARRDKAWLSLLDTDADIALLQEAAKPPADVARRLDFNPAPWRTAGAGVNRPWRSAVVKLTNRVEVEWIETKPLTDALPADLAVSHPGTLAVAKVTPSSGAPFLATSMYAPWQKPHLTTGGGWIYADASAHRLISDLSALVGSLKGHRLLAAGDLNILHGYGEHGSSYWESRYRTVFARMEAIGLSFVGPQSPAGRLADPWPKELPAGSKNVPTYHATHQTPATASRQLDFVFASPSLAESLRVRALNEIGCWGPSDHCCIEIDISC